MSRGPSAPHTMSLFPSGPEPAEVASVTDLTTAVAGLIREGTRECWVKGEVAEYRVWRSGHHYFCLKDARSQMRCVLWRTDAQRLRQPPTDGTEVYVLGRPTLWEEKAEFRFTARTILPTAAIGAAQLELERVRALLQADGLFDPARKRPLPRFPLRIAVVTSVDGAALRDIVAVTRRRWPLAELLVVGARVQGEGAPESIARALRVAARIPGLDLCIVGRGGGARDDLAAFNTEVVCRAIAALPVPSIAAVGHETDVSLADLVADLRAPTPSAAAESAAPDVQVVRRTFDDLGLRMAQALSRRTRLAAERVERYGDRYRAAAETLVTRRRHRLEQLAGRLEALSPLRVLERGYAVPLTPEGHVLRRAEEFVPGSPFRLRIAAGSVRARVEESS